MDEGYAEESEDETQAKESSEAAMLEDTAAESEPPTNSGQI